MQKVKVGDLKTQRVNFGRLGGEVMHSEATVFVIKSQSENVGWKWTITPAAASAVTAQTNRDLIGIYYKAKIKWLQWRGWGVENSKLKIGRVGQLALRTLTKIEKIKYWVDDRTHLKTARGQNFAIDFQRLCFSHDPQKRFENSRVANKINVVFRSR